MQAGPGSVLDVVRAAADRHDWAGALDAARAGSFSDDVAAEAQRLDLLADAAWWLGRLEECTAAREAAFQRYEEVGDHRGAGMCAVLCYEHHAFAARPVMASAWLRRARRVLGDDRECVAFGNLLLREAETAHGAGDLAGALERGTAVIALARRLGSVDLEAEALQNVGRVLIERGDVAEGMGNLDEAMLYAVEGRLGPYATGKVYCSMISACEDLGDYERSAEWTEATQRWAAQHPFCIFPGICRVHRAMVLKRKGAFAEAETEAARACEELRDSRPVASAAAWIEIGDISRRLGDLDRAEEAFRRAQEVSGSPCTALALLRLAQGRVEVARSIIGGCMEGTTHSLARAALLPHFVQVAVAAGDVAAAAAAVEELAAILETYDSPAGQASLRLARGRVLLARGDARGARTVLQEAVARWQVLGVPYEAATAQTLLGQALRECGEETLAVETFADAAAAFDRLGARFDVPVAAPGDASRPTPGGLTGREVEVLRLVAAGLTNNEIAAALYLSAKTVSRHLSNIFTKIGVGSRAAATAFAFEHDLVPGRGAG